MQFVDRVKTSSTSYDLEMPTSSRESKTPARIRSTTHPEYLVSNSGEAYWRRQFFEALDLVDSELSRRFDQPGMKVAAQREAIIIDAANKKHCWTR